MSPRKTKKTPIAQCNMKKRFKPPQIPENFVFFH